MLSRPIGWQSLITFVPVYGVYVQPQASLYTMPKRRHVFFSYSLFSSLKLCVVPRQVLDVGKAQQVLASYPATALQLPCSSTDMMYLIYTSGSTGNPKGVMLNHMGFINLLDWSVKEYGLSSQSSMLLKTAVSFDPSVFEIFAPLALGGRLVIAKPGGHEDPGYIRDLITSERCVTGPHMEYYT